MVRGSSSLQHNRCHHRRPRWRLALRRGVILGGVAALHLATVNLMLRPAPPYRRALALHSGDGPALQIRLLPPPLPVRQDSSSLQRVKTSSVVYRTVAIASLAAAPANVVITTPLPTVSGDYGSAVFGSCRACRGRRIFVCLAQQ